MLSAYLNEVKEFARSDDVYNNSEAYMLQWNDTLKLITDIDVASKYAIIHRNYKPHLLP